MMDQLSYEPAPPKNQILFDLFDAVNRNKTMKGNIIKKIYSKDKIKETCSQIVEQTPHDEFGSLAGWLYAGQDIFRDKIINKLYRKYRNLKVFFIRFTFYSKMYKIYNELLMVKFHPEGDYFHEIKNKYKHKFKNDTINPLS